MTKSQYDRVVALLDANKEFYKTAVSVGTGTITYAGAAIFGDEHDAKLDPAPPVTVIDDDDNIIIQYNAEMQCTWNPPKYGNDGIPLWDTGATEEDSSSPRTIKQAEKYGSKKLPVYTRLERKSQLLDIPLPKKIVVKDKDGKDVIGYDASLIEAWDKFLAQNPSNVMHFFAPNWVRCACSTPAIWHNQLFCPVCNEVNFHYEGYVATYKGHLVTAQDIYAFNLGMDEIELIEEISEEHQASERRILDTFQEDSQEFPFQAITVRIDNAE